MEILSVLHLLTDSKALDPSRIQSHSPLTICLIAVGGNWLARRKPARPEETHAEEPVRQHSTYGSYDILVEPTYVYIAMIYQWKSSAYGRHWELSVLPKDTKGAVMGLEPTSQQVNGQTLYQLS